MDDRDGSFDRFLKLLGIMMLLVAAFWAGRLTAPVKPAEETTPVLAVPLRRTLEKDGLEMYYVDYRAKAIAEIYWLGRQDGYALKCEKEKPRQQ